MVHVVPFHASASRLVKLPTAVHDVADAHDTPFSWVIVWCWLGVGWMVHVEPFQYSASVVRTTPDLVPSAHPTAVHDPPDVQDTPVR